MSREPRKHRSDYDTDVQLLSAAAAGNQPAWVELYARYSERVYDQCCRAGLSREDAEDVAQEVFWAVYEGLERFDRWEHGSFRAWLRTIAERKIALSQRKFAKRRLQQAALWANARGISTDPAEETSADLEALAVALEHVRGCFSAHTWMAFSAYVLEGRSAVDVARELGTTRNVVYLARARVVERLRTHLAQAGCPEESAECSWG